jgi:hypothetical protein
MNTLKKELMQDDTSGNTGLMNIHKYEEGTFSFVKSKSWTKANVDFHKKISLKLNKSSPSTIRTANLFEVLHNLDEDGTQEELGGKILPIPFCTYNNDHTNQQPLINDLIYAIPVIIKGLTSVEMNKKNINLKFESSAQQNQGRKIVIIGDSYARGCAGNMKHNLKVSYKTSGFVKPGACIDTLITSVTGDVEYLTNKDIIVFWGGTNDVSKIIPKVDLNT